MGTFSTKYRPPVAKRYDICFYKERDAELLEENGIECGEITRVGGQASAVAMITSEQRAMLSRVAHLRPIGNQ